MTDKYVFPQHIGTPIYTTKVTYATQNLADPTTPTPTSTFIGLGYLAIALAIYFMPSIIGSGKRNVGAIFILNLFLGWTFIGWVVALVWACCHDSQVVKS
jgi:Superinfection immunity protein